MTGRFSMFPNDGDLITFNDLDEDNIDEILITHYTDETAGPVAWNCVLYTYVDEDIWEIHQIVLEDYLMDAPGELMLHEACVRIADEKGIAKTEFEKLYYVRDVQFSGGDGSKPAYLMYLVDFGYKDGPEIYSDTEVIILSYEGGKWILSETSWDNGWDPADWAWRYGIADYIISE